MSGGIIGPDVASEPQYGPPAPTLADCVERQVAALTADFEGVGGEELPRPPVDLTTYVDAFASAAANCRHENTREVMYGRQWNCLDCKRVLDRAAMRAARGGSSWMFGW